MEETAESLEPTQPAAEEPQDLFTDSEQYEMQIEEWVDQFLWRWAEFHITVTDPYIKPFDAPVVHEPESIGGGAHEFVYPIVDYGNRLSSSKAEDMYSAGMSMAKLYFTIEKMIAILVHRLTEEGVAAETEVQVAIDGYELALRKAFESIINLSQNVVVINFDPAAWGEQYLKNVKVMAAKGYGYPKPTPRDTYRSLDCLRESSKSKNR